MYSIGEAPRFDAQWRAACTVAHVSAETLHDMVRAHYLHKYPAFQTCSLGMFHGPFVVGMVVFSEAPRETSKRYGGLSWELARLWVRDDVPLNGESWLISKAVKHVRMAHPEVKFLVSYADPSAGHTGLIYKAANWTQDGRTDQERKKPRNDMLDPETGRKYSRWSRAPEGAIKVPRVSKNRYVYNLYPRKER